MISLYNTGIAYEYKSTKELKNNLFLLKLMNYPYLMKLSNFFIPTLLKIAYKPTSLIIKKTVFRQFCGGETIYECLSLIEKLSKYNVKTILDFSIEAQEDENIFNYVEKEIIKIIKQAKNNPNIPFAVFKPTGIARFKLLEKISSKKTLNLKERQEYESIKQRFDNLCNTAYKEDIPIMIDAEESWIQPAIDNLVENMMIKYNQKKALVYHTIQMYRKDRLEYYKKLIEKAKKESFYIGMKIVRGAYLEKENLRAKKMGYPSPIHKTKSDTDNDFDMALNISIDNINNVSICCGTHNEKSCLHLVNLIKKSKIKRNDKRIFFSQLYGMRDHISFNLANDGFNVAKYLPYGKIKQVLPYLLRRIEENSSIKQQIQKEIELIKEEIKKREKNL